MSNKNAGQFIGYIVIGSKSKEWSYIFLTINLVPFIRLDTTYKFLKSITIVPRFSVYQGTPLKCKLSTNSVGKWSLSFEFKNVFSCPNNILTISLYI